jgi:SAM-dependent methyltransferase
VQEVELQYELGWERRGQRALSRLAYLTRRLGAKPATDTFSSVLDIGCGKGSLLGTFAPMAKQLAGIDYSVECIGYSRALLRERGYPQCALAVSEAEHLPFDTGAFDFVSALDVIEHLADQAEGVREAFRVLREGHLLFLNSPNRYSVMAPEDHCRLWFVGFLPYRYQRAYVRWKADYNYVGVRLLSYWSVGRLVTSHTERVATSTVPMDGGNDPNDSRLERLLRRSAFLRWLLNSTPLKYFAPSHHLLALK